MGSVEIKLRSHDFCMFVKVNTFLVLYGINYLCVSCIHWTEGRMRGRAVSQSAANTHQAFSGHLWEICGFSTGAKPSPHTLCHPTFTFHKDWRRLSVSVEHRAKLNIFSLSVSLPSSFLPNSLRSFSLPPPPSPSLHPPSWCLTTDCFFSPPQISSFSTKLCLFWWVATGKVMQVHKSLGSIARDKAVGFSNLDIKHNAIVFTVVYF